jgi:hypothetical protein
MFLITIMIMIFHYKETICRPTEATAEHLAIHTGIRIQLVGVQTHTAHCAIYLLHCMLIVPSERTQSGS